MQDQPTIPSLPKITSTHNFVLVNGDTDSIAFKKPDQKPFTEEEQDRILTEINSFLPPKIRFEDDGVFRRFIVLKTKNYVMDDGKKIKIKGSALKATMKEPALQKFIKELVDLLLKDRKDQVFRLYESYVHEIVHMKDMSQWCFRKTITKSVLEPERTNEARVLKALDLSKIREGDRVWLYFKTEEEYSLLEKYDGTYCKLTLLKKLYKTLEIFSKLIDIELFPNYSLVRNRKLIGVGDE